MEKEKKEAGDRHPIFMSTRRLYVSGAALMVLCRQLLVAASQRERERERESGCARVCAGVCAGVRGCARVCAGARECVCVVCVRCVFLSLWVSLCVGGCTNLHADGALACTRENAQMTFRHASVNRQE